MNILPFFENELEMKTVTRYRTVAAAFLCLNAQKVLHNDGTINNGGKDKLIEEKFEKDYKNYCINVTSINFMVHLLVQMRYHHLLNSVVCIGFSYILLSNSEYVKKNTRL